MAQKASAAGQLRRAARCNFLEVAVGYAPVPALRVTYIGELGYELYMPPEYAAGVYESLWDAGRDLGVRNAGYRVIDSLRLESAG